MQSTCGQGGQHERRTLATAGRFAAHSPPPLFVVRQHFVCLGHVAEHLLCCTLFLLAARHLNNRETQKARSSAINELHEGAMTGYFLLLVWTRGMLQGPSACVDQRHAPGS
eukprot:169346-Chlamydomonas_euryale.AAC.10